MMERPFGPVLQSKTCYHAISETSIPKSHCCEMSPSLGGDFAQICLFKSMVQ